MNLDIIPKNFLYKNPFPLGIYLITLMISSVNLLGQNIGLASNFNPSLKHAHLKGVWNYNVESMEDLNYDISKYYDSLFLEKNIKPIKLNDFDFKILKNYVPGSASKTINEKLNLYCEEKNLDAIIIFHKNNYYSSLDPFKNMYYDDIDFGILSYKHAQYRLFYYTNVRFMYYIKKTNTIQIPFVKREGPNYFNGKMIKVDSITFDENLKLINAKEKIDKFLPIYQNHFKSFVFKIIEEINSSFQN